MAKYTIELTDTEDKAMTFCCVSTQAWVDNALKNRARIATDEIVALVVKHCNDNSIQLATGVDAQVSQGFSLGIIKTAKEVNKEAAKHMPPSG